MSSGMISGKADGWQQGKYSNVGQAFQPAIMTGWKA